MCPTLPLWSWLSNSLLRRIARPIRVGRLHLSGLADRCRDPSTASSSATGARAWLNGGMPDGMHPRHFGRLGQVFQLLGVLLLCTLWTRLCQSRMRDGHCGYAGFVACFVRLIYDCLCLVKDFTVFDSPLVRLRSTTTSMRITCNLPALSKAVIT